MKKILASIIIIGTISLTNFVFAQGEIAPTTTGVCQACSSGSPLMASYMTMMSEVITALGGVTNLDPGAIPAQGSNINAKGSRSKQRSTYVSDSTITVTNQARGITSDLKALNKTQERIVDIGNTIINAKFQYDKQIETKIQSDIANALNKQVGSSKLFIKQGQITSTTYGELLRSLIQLHQSIIAIPTAQSGYSFTRQGYQSNPAIINKIISYYSCAQDVVVCNKNTAKLKSTTASVKGYRSDIVRAFESIEEVFSKSYRDTGKRSGNMINFGDGFGQAWSDTKDIGASLWGVAKGVGSASATTAKSLRDVRPGGGNRKQRSKDRQAKRAARQAQKEAQAQTVSDIEATKEAVRKGDKVTIESTTVQAVTNNSSPQYTKGEISLLSAALNAANDQVLSDRIETQRYTISNDSTPTAYKIPLLTKQIYDTTQVVKVSANEVIKMCKIHCKGDTKGYCGKEVN